MKDTLLKDLESVRDGKLLPVVAVRVVAEALMALRADVAEMRGEMSRALEQVRGDRDEITANVDEALTEIRFDVKKVKRAVKNLRETLAVVEPAVRRLKR